MPDIGREMFQRIPSGIRCRAYDKMTMRWKLSLLQESVAGVAPFRLLFAARLAARLKLPHSAWALQRLHFCLFSLRLSLRSWIWNHTRCVWTYVYGIYTDIPSSGFFVFQICHGLALS
jgi:hypothetical protein